MSSGAADAPEQAPGPNSPPNVPKLNGQYCEGELVHALLLCVHIAKPFLLFWPSTYVCFMVATPYALDATCVAKVGLPWPAYDPPMCSYWAESLGKAFYVTEHFSGWTQWKEAGPAVMLLYNHHGARVAKKMAAHILPKVNHYLGLPPESQGLNIFYLCVYLSFFLTCVSESQCFELYVYLCYLGALALSSRATFQEKEDMPKGSCKWWHKVGPMFSKPAPPLLGNPLGRNGAVDK